MEKLTKKEKEGAKETVVIISDRKALKEILKQALREIELENKKQWKR